MNRYLTIFRRRKAVILAALLLLPASAYFFSKQQDAKYQDAAEVLLNRQNLGNSLEGVQDPLVNIDPERLAKTQADIAATPEVAKRVLQDLKLNDRTPKELLTQTEVLPSRTTDLLTFQVLDRSPVTARRLADAWARTYVQFRAEADAERFRRARVEVTTRLQQVRAEQGRRNGLYRQLAAREQQLQTLETLQTSNAQLVRAADGAIQTEPKTGRNVALAIVLGALLAGGLAALWESLDTRVRSADELGDELDLPLIGRVPEPPPGVRRSESLVMLSEPFSPQAEPIRLLRTNIQFASLQSNAKTFMITSAVQGEGKSTTISNLALSFAQVGKKTALVDLDLRRPILHRFFDKRPSVGITNVALGQVPLEEALYHVDVAGSPTLPDRRDLNGSESRHLDVLFAGTPPPNPGDFVQSSRLAAVLDELAARYDIVFIDAPPLLNVGDVPSLSQRVDGIVVVVRLGVAKRPILKELRRLLGALRAPVLGCVLTGAERDENTYDLGYYNYGYAAQPPAETVSS